LHDFCIKLLIFKSYFNIIEGNNILLINLILLLFFTIKIFLRAKFKFS